MAQFGPQFLTFKSSLHFSINLYKYKDILYTKLLNTNFQLISLQSLVSLETLFHSFTSVPQELSVTVFLFLII